MPDLETVPTSLKPGPKGIKFGKNSVRIGKTGEKNNAQVGKIGKAWLKEIRNMICIINNV